VTDPADEPSDDCDEEVGVRIVREVAAVLGRDPMDLDPLSELVDLDALSALAATGTADVSFEYEGLRVFVRRDGAVEVERVEGERAR
jgi:hypothetical protein